MANFPALVPASRPLTPGRWGGTMVPALSGGVSTVRQGSAEIGRRLSLSFPAISEAQFLELLAHYRGQRSGFDSFAFTTTTIPANYTPSGHQWLYASAPQVIDQHADVFDVVCEFRGEPRGLVRVGGADLTATASLAAGAATGLQTGAASLSASASLVAGTALAATPDASFSSVALLLQFAGADNSTTFIDSGPLSLTATAFGNAKITAGGGKFGSSHGAFDGTGDYITFSSTSVPRFTGDFTIETWANPASIDDRSIASSTHSSDSNVQIFRLRSNGSIEFYANSSYIVQSSASLITASQWYHLAISRTSSFTRMYVNGTQVGATNASWTDAISCNVIGQHFVNGSTASNPGQFNGRLSEFRATSAARYTGSSFTVPPGPFPAF